MREREEGKINDPTSPDGEEKTIVKPAKRGHLPDYPPPFLFLVRVVAFLPPSRQGRGEHKEGERAEKGRG